jgi:multidrug efflux system membrane fusion protein
MNRNECPIKADPDQPRTFDRVLSPGVFVHVRLHVADQPDTLVVPQVAIGSSQPGKYVYVAGNGKAMQRMVSIGATQGDLVAVTKGVGAREAVIVGNLQKISQGAPVRPEAAAGPGMPGTSTITNGDSL